jgi:nitrate/nitrite-specific signal transduction histidine kinase
VKGKPEKIGSEFQRIRCGITAKILVSFLAVSIISVGVISIFALRNMSMVGNTARQNSINLGESAVAENIAALQDAGRRIIKLQARVVSAEVENFIDDNPDMDVYELVENKALKAIAVQSVGSSGYTMVFANNGVIYFHNDSDMVGSTLEQLAEGVPQLQNIFNSSVNGEAAGYFDWEDENGNIRPQYMYIYPIEGTNLLVSASTFIDEFSRPAEETESSITAAVLSTTRYIDNQMTIAQWTFIIVIACMVAIIITLATFMARTITEPIVALTRGSEVIARGDLDHTIEVNTTDEIGKLAEQFNIMTTALKESRANLEQKVEDRTKQERQRAEQLRTINEISQKISSIIKLEDLLPYVANLLRQTFNYHNVNIFLFEPNSGKLVLKAICLSGYQGLIPLDVPLEMGEEGVVAWVAKTGEPLLANDVAQEPRYSYIEELNETKSELAVPIKIGDRIMGVLDIESENLDAFSDADLFTAQTLADQLGIAIENARLYKETGQIAVMEERNRMAREIHDTLAQGFTGIILQLEAAEQALSNNNDVLQHLNKARSLARGSLNEARRSVWDLRPKALEQLSLLEALRQEAGSFASSTNIKTRIDISENTRTLPPEVETTLLRVCQEALNNIRKHAKATEVRIAIAFDDSGVSHGEG